MSESNQTPARPLHLSQAEIDELNAGDSRVRRALTRRLNAESPSDAAATGPQRSDATAGPVDVTAAQLRALSREGRTRTPDKFARDLEESERVSKQRERRMHKHDEPKDAPTAHPPSIKPPSSV